MLKQNRRSDVPIFCCWLFYHKFPCREKKKVVAMVTSCILYYVGHVTDVKLRIAELLPDMSNFLSIEWSFDVTEERHAP